LYGVSPGRDAISGEIDRIAVYYALNIARGRVFRIRRRDRRSERHVFALHHYDVGFVLASDQAFAQAHASTRSFY